MMKNEQTLPKMLSITEVIKSTNLSRKYIMDLIESGEIKYIRTGAKYLINAESLSDYLNGCD